MPFVRHIYIFGLLGSSVLLADKHNSVASGIQAVYTVEVAQLTHYRLQPKVVGNGMNSAQTRLIQWQCANCHLIV